MKKLIALLLCAVLILFMLTACKKQEPISDATDSAKEDTAESEASADTGSDSGFGSIGAYEPGKIESETPAIDTDLGDTAIGDYAPGEAEVEEPAAEEPAEESGEAGSIGEYAPAEIETELPSLDFDLDFGSIGEYNPGEIQAMAPTLIEFAFGDTSIASYSPGAIESLLPEIDFSIEIPDFTYGKTPIESSAPSSLEFEFDDVSLSEGFEEAGITPGEFVFALPDLTYEFDAESFYADEFLASSDGFLSPGDLAYMAEMDPTELMSIAEMKASLMADLSVAFQSSGLSVTMDSTTGEIMIDSAILFGYNEDEVSELGKAMLDRFITVYTAVVFSEKYEGFVSAIQVEGHTDTSGSYEYNLDLSERRAKNVFDYCLAGVSGLSAGTVEHLEEILAYVGCSYDFPIYDENGNVDMDASRRVSFRFIVDLGN